MGTFDALGISASGMNAGQTWIDSISSNIANMNDAVATNKPAYQPSFVVVMPTGADPTTAQPGTTQGVQVMGAVYGSAAGRIVHDPSNPLADAQGNVRYPNVDLGQQMVQMIMAERHYQANTSVFTQARAAYQAALTLGN